MRYGENILYDDRGHLILKSFYSRISPQKRVYNAHHHTECELSVFVSGSGVYCVNDRQYDFTAGDMFLFGSNEAHCITEIREETVLLNIHFEPRILWSESENVEILNLFAARNKKFSNKFDASDLLLREKVLKISEEAEKKKAAYKMMIKYELFSALIHILREYDYTKCENTLAKSFTATAKLKDAMLYIDKNIENKLSLKEIAAEACMAPAYFSAVFKKFNGISPWEYITIKRVEKAVEMLKTSNMNKLEIAQKCGFSSSSNFYKAFVGVTGKKPGEYTKNMKGTVI